MEPDHQLLDDKVPDLNTAEGAIGIATNALIERLASEGSWQPCGDGL